ncbi:MAG: hypothetical protein GY807_20585 [Gammaproteobacteria bacterium]|nr:hypothetical protein [Gammaproteobacteria bacterium]
MMGHRAKFIDGDEWDALTKARQFYGHRAGIVKSIKRRFNKRMRRQSKARLRGDGGTAG